MFTVGIFTTHIPYIIFTAFFMWIFLFGVGNEYADGHLAIENHQTIEVYVCSVSSMDTVDAFYFEMKMPPGLAKFYSIKHLFIPKEIYPEFSEIFYQPNDFRTHFFSRPPPLA
jgi:hypothetical protein